MESTELNTRLHIKYWHRCLKSFLPNYYTANDSNRTTLGFFILASLDLLGAGADTLSDTEQLNLQDWILSCEHPHGGFCGSPNHRYNDIYYDPARGSKAVMDPANLGATFFALLSLAYTGGLSRVRRYECLQWLRKLQRPNGGFGEMLDRAGKIVGGSDMRPCHFAAAIRWVLRGEGEEESQNVPEDIDVDALVRYIQQAETYDGAFGESSTTEAHAGYTYCGVAALALLGPISSSKNGLAARPTGLTNESATIGWLLSQQLEYRDTGGADDQNEESPTIAESTSQIAASLSGLSLEDINFVGCSGRTNKDVDTCYCFWVLGTLDILGRAALMSSDSLRRFLLEQTNHRLLGGFGKGPGDRPDLYHSYLGLAILSVLQEPQLKPLDSNLCISQAAKARLRQDLKDIVERDEARNANLMTAELLRNAKDQDGNRIDDDGDAPNSKIILHKDQLYVVGKLSADPKGQLQNVPVTGDTATATATAASV